MEKSPSTTLTGVLEQALHHHFTHALQGLLPSAIHAHKLKQVLDVQCRIGAWAIDLALAYPGVTVTGLDNNEQLIEMARRSAEIGNVQHVRFYTASPFERLLFDDSTFDFVHLSMAMTLFRPSEWQSFLQECLRVLKPGGHLNIVSLSLGPGSSEAYQRLLVTIDKLLLAQGYGFSNTPGTTSPGVHLAHMMRAANFSDVAYVIRPVNLGGGNNPAGRACCQLLLNDIRRLKHYFLEYKLLSSQGFDRLIEQKQKDIGEPDFCAMGALISVVGQKK